MPECVISGDLASRRIQYFTDKKKTALDGCIGKPDNASLTYSVTPFLQLLTGLTAEPVLAMSTLRWGSMDRPSSSSPSYNCSTRCCG